MVLRTLAVTRTTESAQTNQHPLVDSGPRQPPPNHDSS